MQGAFAEALTNQLVANMNPMNGIARDWAVSQIKVSDAEYQKAKLDLLDRVQKKIADLLSSDGDDVVIEIYRKLMMQLADK